MYIPQSQWVGNTEPMQPPGPDAAKPPRQPWMKAVEISEALGIPCTTPDQIKGAERTMRRMFQAALVRRGRDEFGALVFGVAAC